MKKIFKEIFKNILLVILIVLFILSILFINTILAAQTKLRLATILYTEIIVIFIYSIWCTRKISPKLRFATIGIEMLLVLFYCTTFFINLNLIKNDKEPIQYLYITPVCQCGSSSTHYNFLNYGITSVTVDYIDGTTKRHWILYSYKDEDIGTDIFPRYMQGQISDERLIEILEERKHK